MACDSHLPSSGPTAPGLAGGQTPESPVALQSLTDTGSSTDLRLFSVHIYEPLSKMTIPAYQTGSSGLAWSFSFVLPESK